MMTVELHLEMTVIIRLGSLNPLSVIGFRKAASRVKPHWGCDEEKMSTVLNSNLSNLFPTLACVQGKPYPLKTPIILHTTHWEQNSDQDSEFRPTAIITQISQGAPKWNVGKTTDHSLYLRNK